MKTYLIKTNDMTDKIHAELSKYTKGCVGEVSRLLGVYSISTSKVNIEKIKLLPFVLTIEEYNKSERSLL